LRVGPGRGHKLAENNIVFKIGGRSTHGWSGRDAVQQLSNDYTSEQVTLLSFHRPSENKKYERKVSAGPYDIDLSDRHMEGSVLLCRSHDDKLSVLQHPFGKKWVDLPAGRSAIAFSRVNGIEMQLDVGIPKERGSATIPVNYAFRLR
jgi:hypothetical protein